MMKKILSNKILTMILAVAIVFSFLSPAMPVAAASPVTLSDQAAGNTLAAATSDEMTAGESEDANAEDVIIIEDEEIPLAFARHGRGWALMNLIFSIAGGVLALIMGVHTLLRMRYIYESGPIERRRLLLMLAVPLQAIIGIILFLTTQDGSSFMLLVDGLTIVHALLFLIGVVCYYLEYRYDRDDEGDKYASGSA